MAKLTQEEKDAINDAAKAQWWKKWYGWDYSWKGLAEKPWDGWVVVEDDAVHEAYLKEHGLPEGAPNKACRVIPADKVELLPEDAGTREANLQDYWRDQESDLVECKGQKTYTNIHLPLEYYDGTSTWKDDPDHKKWKALTDLLTKRLESGLKTDVQIGYFGTETVRGQDRRAQFWGGVLPALPSRLEPDQANQEEVTGLNLTLVHAVITKSQNFHQTIFGSAFNAKEAQFAGGDTSFNGAHFTGGNASFNGAHFTGGDASFNGAHFTGGNASFNVAHFTGGYASFNGAHFTGGYASFDLAHFTGDYASFDLAQFTGGNATFRGAQFTGEDASFNGAQFTGGYASFYAVLFTGGEALFSRAWFKISCDFKNALFENQAKFADTIFPPAKGSESAFRGTQFLGAVDFSRDNIEKVKDEKEQILPPEQTLFPFNAFENANIKDQIILSGLGDDTAQKEFVLALASIDAACKEDARDKNVRNKKKKKESRYVALERGCTTLKNAMEKTSDKNRAQRFFKFELLARQKRPSTSPIVSFMTDIYGHVADYGGSIGRPLATLFFVWLGFAILYGVNAYSFIGVRLDNSVNSFIGPLDFSLTHIFRPLFVWSNALDPSEGSWLYIYKERLPYWGWFLIKVLATLQSLASITLLFLFGLATKRKFQIS